MTNDLEKARADAQETVDGATTYNLAYRYARQVLLLCTEVEELRKDNQSLHSRLLGMIYGVKP